MSDGFTVPEPMRFAYYRALSREWTHERKARLAEDLVRQGLITSDSAKLLIGADSGSQQAHEVGTRES